LPARSSDAVLVTPAHQYPTGVTLGPQRRRDLAAWARSGRKLVVEDDYDGEFRYDRRPVGAIQGIAPDHVAYLGSASKTLAPGLRLGWLVLPERLVDPVTAAVRVSTLGVDGTAQLTMVELLVSHAYDRHIRAMRTRYRRRYVLLRSALDGIAGERGTVVAGVQGGCQTAVYLPTRGPHAAEVVARAAGEGLALEALDKHWGTPGPHPQGLLIGFSRPPDRSYPAAVALLAGVLRRAYA
jgi:GntR family transcriptional regulator/MocR family aminotransferase